MIITLHSSERLKAMVLTAGVAYRPLVLVWDKLSKVKLCYVRSCLGCWGPLPSMAEASRTSLQLFSAKLEVTTGLEVGLLA